MAKRTRSAQLFLCHSHADKPFVRRLARDLSTLSVDVWLDEWELTPGDSLHDCIGAALSSIAYVGVVLSPDSVKSQWCRSELQQGLAQEKRTGEKVVLPLLHRRVQPPPFLEDRLYANFSRSYYLALTQLAGFVHALDTRDLAEQVATSKPKGLEDSIEILEACGWKGIKYLNSRDYDALCKILGKIGVNISEDEFDIIPPPRPRNKSKRTTSTKKAAKKKAPKKKAVRQKRLRIKR